MFRMQSQSDGPVLVLHGGAGTIRQGDMDAVGERAHREALLGALEAGWRLLTAGGAALDAVDVVVRLLEDCPLFNAGRGSVFNAAGEIEMDAAVMCGASLAAGAVAGVQGVRNPVSLARAVLADSRFVMLAGRGSEAYARELGVPFEPAAYFETERRRLQLADAQRRDAVELDHDGPGAGAERKFGTVGAVALDLAGNLAAATSTGGLTNKRFGRIGDTPLIGAGTYADNRGCAVSCTGYGEAFIRTAVAHEVSARVRLLGQDIGQAADAALADMVRAGGAGGLIAVDARGRFCLPFTTEGMYRAWRSPAGQGVAMYRDPA